MKTMMASGNGQRHLHDQQRCADGHGIHQRHNGRAADVAAQNLEGPLAHTPQPGFPVPGEGPQEEVPDLRAVLEEEEEDHHHEARAGQELRHHRQAGDGSGPDLAARGELDGAFPGLIQLLAVNGDRAGEEEAFEFVKPLGGLLDQLAPLAADGEVDHGADAGQQEQQGHECHGRGGPAGQSPAPQQVDERPDGGGEDQRDQHGNDQQPDLQESVHGHGCHGKDQQDLGAPDPHPAEVVGPQLAGRFVVRLPGRLRVRERTGRELLGWILLGQSGCSGHRNSYSSGQSANRLD